MAHNEKYLSYYSIIKKSDNYCYSNFSYKNVQYTFWRFLNKGTVYG